MERWMERLCLRRAERKCHAAFQFLSLQKIEFSGDTSVVWTGFISTNAVSENLGIDKLRSTNQSTAWCSG